MKLVLKSNITKRTWEYTVIDKADSRLFYHFPKFKLTEPMDEGEYDYELYDNDDMVAQGLLQIGDYKNKTITTYTTNGTYKQYNG